jgi:hypothetical protein
LLALEVLHELPACAHFARRILQRVDDERKKTGAA